MLSRIVELHDSDVETLRPNRDGRITLVFSSAYIHESEGIPGRDKGRGLTQRAELEIEGGEIVENIQVLPSTISEGFIRLNMEKIDNAIPLPFDRKGSFEIQLTFVSGEVLSLRGTGAKLTFQGEATYVEDFPGM